MSSLDRAQTAAAVETIQSNARLQSQLIEDLLDVSRIVTGKMRLDLRPIELVDVIDSAIASVSPAAKAKNIQIDRTIAMGSACVQGDPDRLQQVLWNLLSNAIKFTPIDGRVAVTLCQHFNQAVVEVSDNGAGIEPRFLPYVFQRFSQENGGTSRRYGGLGLGLAIVKNLVELHGGTVHASSQGVGHGATFRVYLPLASVGAFITTARPTRMMPSKSLDGLRILVVDDDSQTCQLVKYVLELCGADVLTVNSAQEALNAWEDWRPDLLISDLGMPNQDGFDLIQAVRERSAELPAIAFTAFTNTEHRQRSLDSGYQLLLHKPIEPAAFAGAIADVARQRPR
jgi:CheY-like chemotaxis protein/two-component sensor histidine kinase